MDFNNLSSADWQHFSYCTLILIALTAGLITRKELSINKTVKYLAIWLGVAIVLVVLYSYRYEFTNFKNRLAGEINPSKAQANAGKIIINVSQDGHFYVNAKIKGVDIRFMIDTGASDIVINLNDAKRVGINTKNLIFNKSYQTANGITLGASVTLEEVEIADTKFTNINASVNGSEMATSLLGMSFLKQLKKYEVYQDKLILTI